MEETEGRQDGLGAPSATIGYTERRRGSASSSPRAGEGSLRSRETCGDDVQRHGSRGDRSFTRTATGTQHRLRVGSFTEVICYRIRFIRRCCRTDLVRGRFTPRRSVLRSGPRIKPALPGQARCGGPGHVSRSPRRVCLPLLRAAITAEGHTPERYQHALARLKPKGARTSHPTASRLIRCSISGETDP